jgi:hypothetical protein
MTVVLGLQLDFDEFVCLSHHQNMWCPSLLCPEICVPDLCLLYRVFEEFVALIPHRNRTTRLRCLENKPLGGQNTILHLRAVKERSCLPLSNVIAACIIGGSFLQVVPAVVVLRITGVRAFDTESASSSYATGFIVDKKLGLILTNRHVVKPGLLVGVLQLILQVLSGMLVRFDYACLVPDGRDCLKRPPLNLWQIAAHNFLLPGASEC